MGFSPAKLNYEKLAKMLDLTVDEMKDYVAQCRTGGYARIWNFNDNGKNGTAQISVSKKHNDGDFVVGKVVNGYDITFQSFVTLVGSAYQKVKHYGEIPANGLPIQIVSCDVTNKYVKEKNKNYTNFTIFGLNIQTPANTNQEVVKPKKKEVVEEPDDTELPF